MQTDERLLQTAVDDGSSAFVRIYRWSEPTVSLGYFQKSDCRIDDRIRHCPRVRRLTGGGAILHDREITYSCALPASHPVRHTPARLYEIVHQAIIELLAESGVDASLRMNAGTPRK